MHGSNRPNHRRLFLSALGSILLLTGCHGIRQYDEGGPEMLGTKIDEINLAQEHNAEASKFVVYAHEFQKHDEDGMQSGKSWMLNEYGEDHVKQIAANVHRGVAFPIVVERSRTSVKSDTEYGFPVHFNEEMDAKRRRTIVASLEALGVADADQRVVVAPAFAEPATATEASRAYTRSLGLQQLGGRGGFGGFGGGFGGGFF